MIISTRRWLASPDRERPLQMFSYPLMYCNNLSFKIKFFIKNKKKCRNICEIQIQLSQIQFITEKLALLVSNCVYSDNSLFRSYHRFSLLNRLILF